MAKSFEVVIEQDKKTGQFYASVPNLPGCYSYADTVKELLDNIKEAIELHLEAMKEKHVKFEENSVVGMVKVVV